MRWNTFWAWRGAHHSKKAVQVGRQTASNTAQTNHLLQHQSAVLSQQAAQAADAHAQEQRFRYDTDPVFREWWDKDQAAKQAHALAMAEQARAFAAAQSERSRHRRKLMAWALAPWLLYFTDRQGPPLSVWATWTDGARRAATIAYAVGVALFELLFVVAVFTSSPPPPATPTPTGSQAAGGHQVTFEVTTADGAVDLVNWSTLEDSALENAAASPFTKVVTLSSKTGLVGVNASDSSHVSCRLLVDGVVVDEGSSDYTVNCSYVIR